MTEVAFCWPRWFHYFFQQRVLPRLDVYGLTPSIHRWTTLHPRLPTEGCGYSAACRAAGGDRQRSSSAACVALARWTLASLTWPKPRICAGMQASSTAVAWLR